MKPLFLFLLAALLAPAYASADEPAPKAAVVLVPAGPLHAHRLARAARIASRARLVAVPVEAVPAPKDAPKK